MQPRSVISLIALVLGVLPINAMALSQLEGAIKSVDRSLLDAGKSIDKANREVGRAVDKAASAPVRDEVLAAAQVAIREAEEKRNDVAMQVAELKKVSAQIERDKEALEAREKLFSMGFYASFSTTLIAIFGLAVKLPTSKLDKQLKLLEIKERELAIKERMAHLDVKPNPPMQPTAFGGG